MVNKRRNPVHRVLRKARKSACQTLLDQDKFGQPIPLNYMGSDTYKTYPGAVLSIVCLVFLITGLMKGVSNLVQNKEWTETTQTRILDAQELKEPTHFSKYPNLEVGFELRFIDSVFAVNRSTYEEYSARIFEYFQILTVNYKKDDMGFDILDQELSQNTIWFNFDTGEPYRAGTMTSQKLQTNSQNFYEMKANISEMVMFGSESATFQQQTQFATVGLALNKERVYKSVFEWCRDNGTCESTRVSKIQMFNDFTRIQYCQEKYENEILSKFAEFYWDLLHDDKTAEWAQFVYLSAFEMQMPDPFPDDECMNLFARASVPADCALFPEGSKCLFWEGYKNVTAELEEAMQGLTFRPVIYDEIPAFQDGANPYPFEQRKSSFPVAEPKQFPLNTTEKENYQVVLQKQQVCMDNNIWSDFAVLWDDVQNKCEYASDFEALHVKGVHIDVSTEPLEAICIMTISLDNQLQHTVVKSYKFYDMLGDTGGFFEALLTLFSFVGGPISSLSFQHSIARQSYFSRKTSKEIEKSGGEEATTPPEKKFFKRIRFSAIFLILDTCRLSGLICKCCRKLKDQRKLLKKANSRFEDELDVTKLTKKMRLSYDLLMGSLSEIQKKQIKFSKSNVILTRQNRLEDGLNSSTTSSSSSSSSDENRVTLYSKPDPHPGLRRVNALTQPVIDSIIPVPKKIASTKAQDFSETLVDFEAQGEGDNDGDHNFYDSDISSSKIKNQAVPFEDRKPPPANQIGALFTEEKLLLDQPSKKKRRKMPILPKASNNQGVVELSSLSSKSAINPRNRRTGPHAGGLPPSTTYHQDPNPSSLPAYQDLPSHASEPSNGGSSTSVLAKQRPWRWKHKV